MLSLVPDTGQRRDEISRRAFLQVGSLGAFGIGLGDWFAAKGAEARPPARAVILLWLWGGPSHLETFDMKPDAPLEYRGPFEPIATRVPGIQICELLPGLARRADRFALLRAMHHESNDHGVAGTIALTGNIAGAVNLGGMSSSGALRPSTGAIVGRLRKGRPGALPPYIVLGDPLHQGHKRVVGEGGGTLGSAFDPFRLNYEPGIGLKLPEVELPENVSAARLGARWNLRSRLAALAPSQSDPASWRSLDEHYELAHTLIASRQSLQALDVELEPAKVREAYGPHRFGQCCLIARRLVEAGIPFVQVNWSTNVETAEDAGDGGWDMHDRYFQIMQDRHGWMFDRALSALLDDLSSRGLLDTTMIVAVGEFGRTPKINPRAGRDHWNLCYSALVGGGGIHGGRAIGASDKRGEHPTDRPATPADLGATILAHMGITTTDLTGLGLTPLGTVIEELYG